MTLLETEKPTRSSNTLARSDGFGGPVTKPSPISLPDPRAVPPVDPVVGALSKDAAAQARQLLREHRALYTADARRFSRIVRAAQSAVFRQKPGPKP